MMQHCWITPADQLQITQIIHRHTASMMILCQCQFLLCHFTIWTHCEHFRYIFLSLSLPLVSIVTNKHHNLCQYSLCEQPLSDLAVIIITIHIYFIFFFLLFIHFVYWFLEKFHKHIFFFYDWTQETITNHFVFISYIFFRGYETVIINVSKICQSKIRVFFSFSRLWARHFHFKYWV